MARSLPLLAVVASLLSACGPGLNERVPNFSGTWVDDTREVPAPYGKHNARCGLGEEAMLEPVFLGEPCLGMSVMTRVVVQDNCPPQRRQRHATVAVPLDSGQETATPPHLGLIRAATTLDAVDALDGGASSPGLSLFDSHFVESGRQPCEFLAN